MGCESTVAYYERPDADRLWITANLDDGHLISWFFVLAVIMFVTMVSHFTYGMKDMEDVGGLCTDIFCLHFMGL
jgi:hypothetical protein